MPKNYEEEIQSESDQESSTRSESTLNFGQQFMPFLKSIFSLGTEATQFSEEVLKVVLRDFSREITQAARNGVAKGSGELREIIHKELNAFLKSMDVASLLSQVLEHHEIKLSANIHLVPRKKAAEAKDKIDSVDSTAAEQAASPAAQQVTKEKKRAPRYKAPKSKNKTQRQGNNQVLTKVASTNAQKTRRKIEHYLVEEAPQENLTLFQSEKGIEHESKH